MSASQDRQASTTAHALGVRAWGVNLENRIAMNTSDKKPACFADLETVFPLREDGLRVTPITCLQCSHKTPCLRTAIGKASGYRVREEMIDRSYRGGVISFFQRWSQKKSIHRLKKKG